MDTKNIQKLNEAVYILRNFVELSAQLLPFLLKLRYAPKLSADDLADKESIIQLFRNYNFDKEASIQLMNSPVLELISNSFETIIEESNDKKTSTRTLRKFNKEHSRLRKDWELIDAN